MICIVLVGGASMQAALRDALGGAGMRLRVVSGRTALGELVAGDAADIALIDASEDAEARLALAAQLRLTTRLGIVLLLGRARRSERLLALSLGIDHCLHVPPDPQELTLRLRSLYWRLAGLAPEQPSASMPGAAPGRGDAWLFDCAQWRLEAPGGAAVLLSLSEYRILRGLTLRVGEIVPRERLLGVPDAGATRGAGRNLDAIVSRLRRKVERAGGGRLPVRSARGTGYVFTAACIVLDDRAAYRPFAQEPASRLLRGVDRSQ